MQLDHRILHPAGERNAIEAKRRTSHPDDRPLRQVSANNETADHDIVAGQDMAACRDIAETRSGSARIQIINFHEGDAGGVIHSAHDDGVATGLQRRDQRSIKIVRRREAGRDDGVLLGAAPIVIRGDNGAGGVVQFQNGIAQRAGNRQ